MELADMRSLNLRAVRCAGANPVRATIHQVFTEPDDGNGLHADFKSQILGVRVSLGLLFIGLFKKMYPTFGNICALRYHAQ